MLEKEDKLRQFLNLFWLRPENGLLCTFKSEVINDIKFDSPSLDLSCGDGLFTFIHLGGKLDENFDYFQTTNANNFEHDSFVDIYDHYNENYTVTVTKKPANVIDYGTDWKKSLLDKAEKLSLYKNLIVHDNNKTPLPFEENYFKVIYSNSVYWVKDVENLLNDIHRILKPDGTAVLEVATPFFYELLDELESTLSPEAISILDRNRRKTSPGLHQYNDWMAIFQKSGFQIEDVRSVYPNKILLDIWNIGLRPISHLLVQMNENNDPIKKAKIKKEWVEIFFQLFKPLLQLPQTYTIERAPYLMFILKK